MVKITIELTEEQMSVFSDKEEVIGMVTNYANHKIDTQLESQFRNLSIKDKKIKLDK